MNSTPTRKMRVLVRHHLVSVLVGTIALCLIAPTSAFASTAVSQHNQGDNSSHVAISGTIVSLGGGSIVVQDRDGFWRTIVLGGTTSYTEGPMNIGPAITASNLAVGLEVTASGTVDANHTSLDASAVRIELSRLAGTVRTVSASSLTVSTDNGSTTSTIDLSSQTVVFSNSAIVSLSSVAVGSLVEGFGVFQSDGSLLALYLGVGSDHQGLAHGLEFGVQLPNRLCPNHYGEHGLRK